MFDPDFAQYNRGSYVEPVVPPTGSPFDLPTVCVEVAAAWVPYITGALSQLAHPATWAVTTEAALWDVLGRVQDVIAAVGEAGQCMGAGAQALTVSSGAFGASIGVLFPQRFASAPIVVVSESTGVLIASVDTVTATGFTASVTANVAASVDMPTILSWVARVPS